MLIKNSLVMVSILAALTSLPIHAQANQSSIIVEDYDMGNAQAQAITESSVQLTQTDITIAMASP